MPNFTGHELSFARKINREEEVKNKKREKMRRGTKRQKTKELDEGKEKKQEEEAEEELERRRKKQKKKQKKKRKKKNRKGNLHLTGQHGENGGEGVEFESVDDVAGVEKLETHEAEADHQQQDVEHLGHHGQPQHAYRHQQTTQSDRPHIDASRTSEATRAQNAGEKLCLPFVPTSAIHSSAVQ